MGRSGAPRMARFMHQLRWKLQWMKANPVAVLLIILAIGCLGYTFRKPLVNFVPATYENIKSVFGLCNTWGYYHYNGKILGSATDYELSVLYKAGTVTESTLVKLSEWVHPMKISEVRSKKPELAKYLPHCS